VTKVDETTVLLELSAPYAPLPVALGNRYMRVIKAGTTDFTDPVGTGPYMYEAHTPGQSFTATRNDDYWGTPAPYERIESQNVPDPSSRVEALMASEVDAVETISYAQIPTVEQSDAHELVLLDDQNIPAVDLDLTVEPFNDPRVVEAIKLALDRDQLIETVFNGYGNVGYDTPVPASDPRFPQDLAAPERDLERARDLLAEAGFPDGFETEFFVSEVGPSMREFGAAISQQLSEVGIDFTINQWPEATFWDNVWLSKSTSTPLYIRRHPDEILTYLATCEGPWNGTHWCNEEFDAAVEGARAELDAEAQKEFYATAITLSSQEDGHLIPVTAPLVAATADNAPLGTSVISLIDFAPDTE
jgi:peptide/nickel transport system substrate-binding protein